MTTSVASMAGVKRPSDSDDSIDGPQVKRQHRVVATTSTGQPSYPVPSSNSQHNTHVGSSIASLPHPQTGMSTGYPQQVVSAHPGSHSQSSVQGGPHVAAHSVPHGHAAPHPQSGAGQSAQSAAAAMWYPHPANGIASYGAMYSGATMQAPVVSNMSTTASSGMTSGAGHGNGRPPVPHYGMTAGGHGYPQHMQHPAGQSGDRSGQSDAGLVNTAASGLIMSSNAVDHTQNGALTAASGNGPPQHPAPAPQPEMPPQYYNPQFSQQYPAQGQPQAVMNGVPQMPMQSMMYPGHAIAPNTVPHYDPSHGRTQGQAASGTDTHQLPSLPASAAVGNFNTQGNDMYNANAHGEAIPVQYMQHAQGPQYYNPAAQQWANGAPVRHHLPQTWTGVTALPPAGKVGKNDARLRSSCDGDTESDSSRQCRYCSKELSTRYNRNIHEKVVHLGNKPHVCKMCDRKFGVRSHLTMHMNTVHKPEATRQHKCPECGKLFLRSYTMGFHRRAVHGVARDGDSDVQRFPCKQCGKTFTRVDTLRRHDLTVHQRLAKHECRYCGRMFGQKSHMRTHERTVHLKQKPFECRYCNHRFGEKSNRTTHERIKHPAEVERDCVIGPAATAASDTTPQTSPSKQEAAAKSP